KAAAGHLASLRDGPPRAPSSPRRRKALYALAPALFVELRGSSDPDVALRHMADFVAAVGARSSFLALLNENPETLRLLIGLFSSSEPLSSFFLRHPELIDSLVRADLARVRKERAELVGELESLLAEAEDYESRLDTIRRFRSEEFLRIGVNDIHGLLTLAEVQEQLSDLAEACLEAAIAVATDRIVEQLGPWPGRFAVIGMGKLGSRELNYNSDLDLIFIWDAPSDAVGGVTPGEYFTKLAQRLLSVLQVKTREGFAYRIDTRLRPSGAQGPLVSSLDSFREYHRTSSHVWERQALTRARAVAGAPSLSEAVERIIEEFVYGRGLSDEERAEIARLRARMESELARETPTRWNLKTGRGGLVDVEFVVQMLQLAHGHVHPPIRQRRIEAALDALHRAGLLADGPFERLAEGHRFLRILESRLRLESEQAVEIVDIGDPDVEILARRLGFTGTSDDVRDAFQRDLRRIREHVRAAYDEVFGHGAPRD
ncbi:MAG: bifunctional [glutamate--ammonia ligase]-adenylyl-L-tyrosine phosphorylase/[glutamate--ammonia-ligase] adenylyltransferase, partial [Candidatus Binatia bacterium]